MNNKLRSDITKIAQGNIQEVLKPMLDRIEALEEAMDAMSAAPEVVQEPEVSEIQRQHNNLLKEETLEGENDYVLRNLEVEECEELETKPEPESTSDVVESDLEKPKPAVEDLTEQTEESK